MIPDVTFLALVQGVDYQHDDLGLVWVASQLAKRL